MITNEIRAALLYVLWHHQGGSSDVGQPIRLMLGIGQHEHLSVRQVDEAQRVSIALSIPAPRGTDAQILKERELTALAIQGAIAYGQLGKQEPPDDSAWLRPFYDIGKQLSTPERQQVLAQLCRLACIVGVAVDDWGESFADGSSEVKFHPEESKELSDILDSFDSLPDGPDERVIESGPLKAARMVGLPSSV